MNSLFDLTCRNATLSIRSLLFVGAIGETVLVSVFALPAQATPVTFRFGSWLWRAAVVLPLLTAGFVNVAEATPLEFRFDAVVTEVEDSSEGNLTLPFDVAVGDVINGKLVLSEERMTSDGGLPNFEPVDLINVEVAFDYESINFESRKYRLVIVNDVSELINPISIDKTRRGPVDVMGALELRWGDSGVPPLRDLVVLNFAPGSTVPFYRLAPNAIPDTDGTILWQPVLTFSGTHVILMDGSSPLGVSVWNAFSTRELQLGFETPRLGFGNSIIISASIGDLVAIPEPSTSVLIIIGFFASRVIAQSRNC